MWAQTTQELNLECCVQAQQRIYVINNISIEI